jgi:CRISPR/Cas system CMR subunit Cmr6 (Cas7 group RAMP superfamily)
MDEKEMDKEKLSLSQKISILNERQIAFTDQQKRFFSHIDSERAHFKTYSELINTIDANLKLQTALLEKDIKNNSATLNELKELWKKHDQLLINGGKGLVFEVDRINNKMSHNKEGRAAAIAIISVVISVLGVVIRYLQK